ncbi:MAG: hypothetical protein QQN63_10220 [Nitrosopumilus sp.]
MAKSKKTQQKSEATVQNEDSIDSELLKHSVIGNKKPLGSVIDRCEPLPGAPNA